MALVNPNIAMSYRGVELPQQNALADYAAIQQIQGGQRQAELSQMQIDSMRRDQAALTRMQAAITAKGGPADLNVAADEMIKSGIPEYLKQGLVIKQTLDKQSRFASLLGPSGGAASAAAPPSEAYPGYNESIGMRAPTNALAPASEAYPGYNEAIGMTNALAPAPAAAPSNAMNLSDMRNRINQAYSIGTPEALAWAKAREKEIEPTTDVSTMRALGFEPTPQGFAKFRGAQHAPPAPTTLSRLQTELAALPKGDPRIPDYEAMIKKETSHAPGVSVNVSTEKKYGEAFGGKLADVDIGKLTAAEKAPQLAESANRIIGLVSQGNVFTGPVADIKLNIARALNVAGTNNEQKIANTEQLIQGTGQSTLDAIKSAGLGTGQGFTDKDLKFLQGIAGGTINLTAQTLTTLAELQHRAATRSAESWNKRVKEVPSEVLKGTGLSTTPITVAPLTAGKAAGPTAGTIQDGYRFKGGSPADPKNWEKM